MPLWKPEGVETEPEVTLNNWIIVRIRYKKGDEDTEDRLIGTASGAGRMSSRIKSFNKDKLEATTRSGRTYDLSGSTGLTSGGAYMFDRIKPLVYSVEDVTLEYFDDDDGS